MIITAAKDFEDGNLNCLSERDKKGLITFSHIFLSRRSLKKDEDIKKGAQSAFLSNYDAHVHALLLSAHVRGSL